MKKPILSILLIVAFALRALADEGMWLPMLLGQQVYNDMVKKGLKLTKEQLYSINRASIKDAVIIFGGGCTGSVVSPEGLVFTNHHCGYSVIAGASTVEHNYLKNGFYAASRGEEIPAQGLSVQFLLRIEDVTKEMLDSLGDLKGEERMDKQGSVSKRINQRFSEENKNIEARVNALFKGNQFLVFIYQRYNDIRLVGAPPESVGKFGGDTDNWEWPRHTGDFSVFRIYMSKEGMPAPYSTENIPLKPKWFFPVSIKGVKENDYAMIFGYPGSTNRYETSFGIRQKIDIDNPAIVKLRGMRLKYMMEEMKKDPSTRLQLASWYASVANYWKFYDGERKQLIKYDVYDQKKEQEAQFLKWAGDKPAYRNLFNDWSAVYDDWRPYSLHRIYLNEGFMGSMLFSFAASLRQVEAALVNTRYTQADAKKAVNAADAKRKDFLKEMNIPSDRNILTTVLQMFYQDIPKDQHPIGFYTNIRNNYGRLDDETSYRKYINGIFEKTMLLNDDAWNRFVANPDAVHLQEDPAFALANALITNYLSKYSAYYQRYYNSNNDLGRLYLKGVMEMNPGKVMYPDATFTMRVTYGSVKPYKPRDAVTYDYVCTMKGVLEKYVPGDDEFDLPPELVEKARKRDFGPYIDRQRNDLVVCFITTNDITGGNSGSPVLNGSGELLGLCFDGNYEALSHKVAFDRDLNRTICVDVRYILWCIDKLGGATDLIKELKLMK